jgi:ATP-dependent exoDNAse (exonuclease V) beta subunit
MARHLLVDEYQDINADQDRMIQTLMSGQTEGLFAVGDDDQSVYGFRGGDPRYIRTFQNTYPNAAVLQLKVSRRCLKNILDCAITVVSRFDTGRIPKADPSYTETDPGLVQVWNCPSEQREANLIAKLITKKAADGDAVDFFVLVPNRNYVQPISQALNALGVAHEDGTSGAKSKDWSTLQTVKEWIDEPSDLVTRHVVELIIFGGKTKMPGPKVKLPEKKGLRHDYASQVADLWGPVLAGTTSFAETLEHSGPRSLTDARPPHSQTLKSTPPMTVGTLQETSSPAAPPGRAEPSSAGKPA